MFSVIFDIEWPELGDIAGANEIMTEFAKQGGPILVEAVQHLLGTDEVYPAMSENYKKLKPGMKDYAHIPGKPDYQPLILSGEHIYNALTFQVEPDGFSVFVNPEDAFHGNFDVAAYWNARTDFLQLAWVASADKLNEILVGIITEKMGLQ